MKINFFNKKFFSTKILILTALFIILAVSLLIENLVQIKKSQLQNSLLQEAASVENVLLERFNSTFFVIEKMSKEIEKNPYDKFYIKKIIEKYKSDTSLNQIFSWTIFSWTDQNSRIIVDSEYGIMKNGADLSGRDYIPEAIAKPRTAVLGRSVYGSTSKEWMIPGGMSVVDGNGKLLGTLTIGFEIANLAKAAQKVIKNENINVELIYKKQIPVFNISSLSNKIFSAEEIAANLQRDQKEISSDDRQMALERSLENYQYRLILTYDKKAVSRILWEIIYSRLIEILSVILLAATLLIAIYKSEKEKREKIISLAQREVTNKSKNEFMLQVSHELKNFVAAINGLSDLVKEDLQKKKSFNDEDSKEELEYLEHIDDISQEMMSFISDLVDLNKSEDGKFEIDRSSVETDFEDMIDRSVRILKSKIKNKNIVINTSFDVDLHRISNLDQRRIKQIFVSIIGNAIKFSALAAKIDITVRNLDHKKIEIIIKDCGVGMDETTIEKSLADYDFAKCKNDNNSTDSIELKLPIVRFLVEKQNGTIAINSRRNYGTEVKIVF